MKKILKINPQFRQKKQSNPPNYKIDFENLPQQLNQIILELQNLLNNPESELAFQLEHQIPIPPKSKRINKELLEGLKWQNKGSIYENEKIILLITTSMANLKKNLDLLSFLQKKVANLKIDAVLDVLKKDVQLKVWIKKDLLPRLLFFISRCYFKITSYKGVEIESDKEYYGTILCNEQLFEATDVSKKEVFLDAKNQKYKHYLHNIRPNNNLSFTFPTLDQLVRQPIQMPKATNKVQIGILDQFGQPNENCIVKNYLDQPYKTDEDHGELVATTAIMGDQLNNFDDGCGVFQTILAVVAYEKISEKALANNIKKAIQAHPEIRIWNLSLGSQDQTINPFKGLSLLAQELDQIAQEKKVIFVIAGGNDLEQKQTKLLSIPADALQSIKVNALNANNEPTSYARQGASFLNYSSPTCAIFGGDQSKGLISLKNGEKVAVTGTSFAAPLVCRILAKIIETFPQINNNEVLALFYHGLHLKAEKQFDPLVGITKLPLHIDHFIKTPDDAIRMVFSGTTQYKKNECLAFDLPLDDGKFNNEIIMTTVSQSIIDHNYGVEAIRTNIVSKIFIRKNDIKNNKHTVDQCWFEHPEFLTEKELIENNKKWFLVASKKLHKQIQKPHWNPQDEFVSAEIVLENNNRNSTDYDELRDTKINYAIVIEIQNRLKKDNFVKVLKRLKINNFEPKILVEHNLKLEADIDIKK